MSDEDSELNNLLAELESGNKVSSTALSVDDAPIPKADDTSGQPPKQELILVEPERIKGDALPSSEDDPLNMAGFIQRFLADYELAHGRIHVDRQRLIAATDLIYNRVQMGQATDIETESLFKGLAALMDSNGYVTRLMDSTSKLLSSAKPAFVINQNIGGQSDTEDLMRILKADDASRTGATEVGDGSI